MDDKHKRIEALLRNNAAWAKRFAQDNPGIFEKLSEQQAPKYLWIGCSDSRIPANEVMGLLPGEVFVHRNVGNLVHSMDINCHSVIQFAVEYLQVRDIIVGGHYDCGAIKAALSGRDYGMMNNWLSSIKNAYMLHREDIESVPPEKRIDRVCEINVIQQVKNVCKSHAVQKAWAKGQELYVHGLIYSVRDGILRDLKVSVDSHDNLDDIYKLNLHNPEV